MRKSTKTPSVLSLKDSSKVIKKKSTKSLLTLNGKVNKKHVASKAVKNLANTIQESIDIIPKVINDEISNLVSIKPNSKKGNNLNKKKTAIKKTSENVNQPKLTDGELSNLVSIKPNSKKGNGLNKKKTGLKKASSANVNQPKLTDGELSNLVSIKPNSKKANGLNKKKTALTKTSSANVNQPKLTDGELSNLVSIKPNSKKANGLNKKKTPLKQLPSETVNQGNINKQSSDDIPKLVDDKKSKSVSVKPKPKKANILKKKKTTLKKSPSGTVNQANTIKGSNNVIPKLTDSEITNLVSIKPKSKKGNSLNENKTINQVNTGKGSVGIISKISDGENINSASIKPKGKLVNKKKIAQQKSSETGGGETAAKTSKATKKLQQSEIESDGTAAKKSKANKLPMSVSTIPLVVEDTSSTNEKQLENTEQNDDNDIECEPKKFNEDIFNSIVSKDKVRNLVGILKSKVENEVSKTKKIFTDFQYLLNVTSFKIPNCPKRIVKLNLKHPLYSTKENDIVFITKDLHRGSKVDYDPTIQFYEDLLRSKGLENLKILPFNQLRKEFNTFELKRKLSNLYDYYLCDGSIVGHVTGCLGSTFQKTRCALHAVRTINHDNIKSEIDKSLKRTSFLQLRKGNIISIPIGTHKQSEDEISDNIIAVVEQLKSIFPGSLENIRSMYIKIDITGTSSLPIYVSLAKPIKTTPSIIGMRERRLNKLKREANLILSKFKIMQNAKIEKLSGDSIKQKGKLNEEGISKMTRTTEKMKGNLPTKIKKVATKNIKGKKPKKIELKKNVGSDDENDHSD